MSAMTSLTMILAAIAGAAGPEMPQGDLGRLQGVWACQAGPKKNIPVELEFRGRDVKVVITPPVGPIIRANGQLALGESVAPKTLDWLHFSAIDGQEFPEMLGIYELDGDTLRICNGGLNNPRPAKFAPGDGLLADVLTFQRRPR